MDIQLLIRLAINVVSLVFKRLVNFCFCFDLERIFGDALSDYVEEKEQ